MIRHLLQINSRLCTVAALVTFATLVFGCNKKEQSVSQVAPPVAVQPKKQLAQAVQKTVSSSSVKLTPPPSANQFDFSGKKDPFKPDIAIKTVTAPSHDESKKALKEGLPIHSFDVSQFRLIGVITGAKENQAMVIDPNGKGYVLKKGMTIGKNDGRVTSVSINGVDVIEQFKDDSGRVRKENIRITLPRKQ
jgi:type IV pilus assembly protein PilP